jgi:SAM-dependent methyltransferase
MSFLGRIDGRNWKVYQRGCDASKYEKAKALQKQFINLGFIVDFGSGTLIVEQMLSELYFDDKEFLQQIHVIGLDLSSEMMKIANSRKKECKGISLDLIRSDITKPPYIADESVDNVILFSTLHEIYSDSRMETSLDVLRYTYRILKPDGRLIIRDGPKPNDETVYLKLHKKKIEKLFYRFAEDFEPSSEKDIIKQGKYKFPFSKLDDGMIEVKLPDCFEFLVKYFYKENWPIEVKERWGVLTPRQWKKTLKDLHFNLIYKNIHLIPYFQDLWKKDGIELYNRVNGKYVRDDYPDSHIILVAEKARI